MVDPTFSGQNGSSLIGVRVAIRRDLCRMQDVSRAKPPRTQRCCRKQSRIEVTSCLFGFAPLRGNYFSMCFVVGMVMNRAVTLTQSQRSRCRYCLSNSSRFGKAEPHWALGALQPCSTHHDSGKQGLAVQEEPGKRRVHSRLVVISRYTSRITRLKNARAPRLRPAHDPAAPLPVVHRPRRRGCA